MAATFVWTLQGTSPTTIDGGGTPDKVQFAGAGGFNTAITVGQWNDTTHVKSNAGANDSSGNTPNNNKFISQSGGTGGDSQVAHSGGTTDLDATTQAQAALKIDFSDGAVGSVTTSAVTFYSYDGTTPATAQSNIEFRSGEVTDGAEDANFSTPHGSGAGMTLNGQGPAANHIWYVVVTASPTTPGLKTAFAMGISLTYQ